MAKSTGQEVKKPEFQLWPCHELAVQPSLSHPDMKQKQHFQNAISQAAKQGVHIWEDASISESQTSTSQTLWEKVVD